MLYTKSSRLLPLLTDPEHIHRFFVLLLALAATLIFWLESVVTPPMVSHNQSPARTPAVARNHPVANLVCSDAPAPRLQPPAVVLKPDNLQAAVSKPDDLQAAVLKPDDQNATVFPYESRLEKQNNSNQRDLFQLIHKKLSANGRMGKWVDVAAGYGQICGVESGLGKCSVELERPGCAYLKASFSF